LTAMNNLNVVAVVRVQIAVIAPNVGAVPKEVASAAARLIPSRLKNLITALKKKRHKVPAVLAKNSVNALPVAQTRQVQHQPHRVRTTDHAPMIFIHVLPVLMAHRRAAMRARSARVRQKDVQLVTVRVGTVRSVADLPGIDLLVTARNIARNVLLNRVATSVLSGGLSVPNAVLHRVVTIAPSVGRTPGQSPDQIGVQNIVPSVGLSAQRHHLVMRHANRVASSSNRTRHRRIKPQPIAVARNSGAMMGLQGKNVRQNADKISL
jgi:hypothetical protein